MQQLVALGIAALVWGVVCFSCGFIVAVLRRLASENKMLRSAVSALSGTSTPPPPTVTASPDAVPAPHQQQSAASSQPEPTPEQPHVLPSEALHLVPVDDEPLVTTGRPTTAAPQPHPAARKVYLFGDHHAEQLWVPKHQPLPLRSGSTGWPNQHLTSRVITHGSDLLPRRVQHARRRFRGRR
jgi:hypothetical protein